MPDEDQRLLEQVRQALDAGVDSLDGATRSRLAQARARALDHPRRHWRWWLPVGGAVFASLLVGLVWLRQPPPLPGAGPLAGADFELLTAGEDLELYQELEFYRWLDEESVTHAN